MKLTTPDEKESVEDYEDNHTQMIFFFEMEGTYEHHPQKNVQQ